MSKDLLVKFRENARFMFNEDEVIICNRLSGLWLKISKECYDILLEKIKFINYLYTNFKFIFKNNM